MRRLGATILIMFALIAAGCADAGTTNNPSPGTSTSQGTMTSTITVKRTGGIAGFNDTWTVAPDGSWTHTNKTGTSTRGSLTTEQIAQVNSAATNSQLATEAKRGAVNTQCRDAFNYEISAGTAKVAWADCPADGNLPTAAMALVTLVTGFTQ